MVEPLGVDVEGISEQEFQEYAAGQYAAEQDALEEEQRAETTARELWSRAQQGGPLRVSVGNVSARLLLGVALEKFKPGHARLLEGRAGPMGGVTFYLKA